LPNRIRLAFAVALGFVVAVSGAVHTASADRPGTPSNVVARNCGIEDNAPLICGTVETRSNEVVRYESRISENSGPLSAGMALSCPLHIGPSDSCIAFDVSKEGQLVEWQLTHAKFDTDYCFAFRVRRLSDQMVSEQWSSQGCVRTPPMPPVPAKPQVAVAFTGSLWSNGQQVPQFATVTLPPTPLGWVSSVSFGGPFFTNNSPRDWAHTIDPQQGNQLPVTVCMANPAGKTCSSETFSISTQKPLLIDGQSTKPIHVTGRAPGETPAPVTWPSSLFNGDWKVTSSQGGDFTLSLKLIQGSLMGAVIAGSDASQKGTGHGKQLDVTHAEVVFTQPGVSRGGTIDLTLTGDGSHFTGLGQGTAGGAITWTGTKIPAPPSPN
jgi:hypothetical protein